MLTLFDSFKCPDPGCGKEYDKYNSLTSHISDIHIATRKIKYDGTVIVLPSTENILTLCRRGDHFNSE